MVMAAQNPCSAFVSGCSLRKHFTLRKAGSRRRRAPSGVFSSLVSTGTSEGTRSRSHERSSLRKCSKNVKYRGNGGGGGEKHKSAAAHECARNLILHCSSCLCCFACCFDFAKSAHLEPTSVPLTSCRSSIPMNPWSNRGFWYPCSTMGLNSPME